MTRVLKWNGGTNPYVSSVPYGSPGNQPLYGLGANLAAVYVRGASDLNNTCFTTNSSGVLYYNNFCFASVRNVPYNEWSPSIVVWPINSTQVQIALRFANTHNLCVMVAGTGHDYLNRHSCKDGVFIRTSLLKNISWDLTDSRGLGNPDGNVKLGAGLVWGEVQQSAAANNRFVVTGWDTTVGVVGWTLGGGHGYMTPGYGLGVDNLLEA
jgi:ribonuclease T2